MQRKTTLVTMGVMAFAAAAIAPGASGAAAERISVTLGATNGYYVDNDPAGDSGGDMFGASGELRQNGKKTGSFTSACTSAPPVGAQCQATFIFSNRGRVQLAGNLKTQSESNVLSIVGGTREFRRAEGTARLKAANKEGSMQRVHLRILN